MQIIHLLSIAATARRCPDGMAQLEASFSAEGQDWTACEDLSTPGGSILLVPSTGPMVWQPKTYENFQQGLDSDYYLGLDKGAVLAAKWDVLGQRVLTDCSRRYGKFCEPTWAHVERALPIMRYSRGNRQARGGGRVEWMCSPYAEESGVRTFVGSRSSSVDATFSDHADDCTDNGFPRPQTYVMNLTAIAHGEPAIKDFISYINFTTMADGLVGGVNPNVIFYFPIIPQNFSGFGGSRYWTMIASPVPDMQGGREQSVWFRFQQIMCTGEHTGAPYRPIPPCHLHGKPQYYDTYWYSSSPGNITNQWIPPSYMANASGFYSNLLAVKRYWDATLEAEGMMMLELPATSSNNGSWLVQQATHAIVRSMISRDDTWHGRYGVLPGYGISLQDGFEDTFTATATGALEFGSIPYAKGVIDNWLKFYVRSNGMTSYRSEEVAQAGRMLSIFNLYYYMTGDDALLLTHWPKIKALADWLLWRWQASVRDYPLGDPRYGIPPGLDEGDGFIAIFAGHPGSHGGYANQLNHMYSCAGGVYRGFADAGEMWAAIGTAHGRKDIVAHATELLAVAPKLRAALQSSIAKTSFTITEPGPRHGKTCIVTGAGRSGPGGARLPAAGASCTDGGGRSYPELFYSGVLTRLQVDDIYETLTTSNNSKYATRPMTLGCAGYNNKQVTFWAYGIPYGLLQHDFVERFLLHYFAMSAHTYTRGSWTTPEAVHPDRDVGSTDYVAAGVMTAPTYLKWMLLYEEPDNRTLWLAKALPRDWLEPSAAPVLVERATTRYGRVSYVLHAVVHPRTKVYTVRANVTLPLSFVARAPRGGLKLRLRAPLPYAGRLKAVTVGGKSWVHFDATLETVDVTAAELTASLIQSGLPEIVAEFG